MKRTWNSLNVGPQVVCIYSSVSSAWFLLERNDSICLLPHSLLLLSLSLTLSLGYWWVRQPEKQTCWQIDTNQTDRPTNSHRQKGVQSQFTCGPVNHWNCGRVYASMPCVCVWALHLRPLWRGPPRLDFCVAAVDFSHCPAASQPKLTLEQIIFYYNALIIRSVRRAANALSGSAKLKQRTQQENIHIISCVFPPDSSAWDFPFFVAIIYVQVCVRHRNSLRLRL